MCSSNQVFRRRLGGSIWTVRCKRGVLCKVSAIILEQTPHYFVGGYLKKAADATLTIGHAGVCSIDSVQISNYGLVTWNGTGDLTLTDGESTLTLQRIP